MLVNINKTDDKVCNCLVIVTNISNMFSLDMKSPNNEIYVDMPIGYLFTKYITI